MGVKYTAKPGHRELTTRHVVSAGHRLALTILDFERAGPGLQMKSFANLMRGSGPFLHTNPEDRWRPSLEDTPRSTRTARGRRISSCP